MTGPAYAVRYHQHDARSPAQARIKAAGGTLDSEPVDTPWGTRVFRLHDPDGFKYAISSKPK